MLRWAQIYSRKIGCCGGREFIRARGRRDSLQSE
jgi:hypothetical protein